MNNSLKMCERHGQAVQIFNFTSNQKYKSKQDFPVLSLRISIVKNLIILSVEEDPMERTHLYATITNLHNTFKAIWQLPSLKYP